MSSVFGMIRAMSAVPRVHLASPVDNAREISHMLQAANEQHADLCVFPELCLCGYTCGDLLLHPPLLDGCRQALEMLNAHETSLPTVGSEEKLRCEIRIVQRTWKSFQPLTLPLCWK